MKFQKLVTTVIFMFLFSINSIVSAHYLTSFEERNIGMEAIKLYEQQNKSYTDGYIVNIQNCLIEANPNELNRFDDGKHKRYLSDVKISTEPVVNGFSFPGGFTYLTKDLIEMIDTIRDDGYGDLDHLRNHKDIVNVYNKGTIAFVMAHEFGHFANEDYLRKTDKQMTTDMLFAAFGGTGDVNQSMIEDQAHSLITELNTKQMSLRTEEQADAKGLDFIENIPQWGTGNAAIFFHRLWALESREKTGKDTSNPHSSTELRLQRVFDKMKEDSNGRVEIKHDRLFVDGKLFMGTGLLPAKEDVTAQDRTYYVAGQLATAIKHGILKKDTVNIRTQNDITKNKNLNLVFILGSGSGTKVLDFFDFTESEYNNAITKTDDMILYDELMKLTK